MILPGSKQTVHRSIGLLVRSAVGKAQSQVKIVKGWKVREAVGSYINDEASVCEQQNQNLWDSGKDVFKVRVPKVSRS